MIYFYIELIVPYFLWNGPTHKTLSVERVSGRRAQAWFKDGSLCGISDQIAR